MDELHTFKSYRRSSRAQPVNTHSGAPGDATPGATPGGSTLDQLNHWCLNNIPDISQVRIMDGHQIPVHNEFLGVFPATFKLMPTFNFDATPRKLIRYTFIVNTLPANSHFKMGHWVAISWWNQPHGYDERGLWNVYYFDPMGIGLVLDETLIGPGGEITKWFRSVDRFSRDVGIDFNYATNKIQYEDFKSDACGQWACFFCQNPKLSHEWVRFNKVSVPADKKYKYGVEHSNKELIKDIVRFK